ncbi:glycoside hydrolase family 95 protein [Sphingobacterium sp. HJSM2_6]|uniref:glycoside hydrolase family 95 protein n=1 Tax=Sphingobacterium sp. HJSM2_6 TaxID=3366264 RepID=UPI003BD1662F
MKRFFLNLCYLIPLICAAQESEELALWYNKPASQWVEALPIGNGRLAGMVFGDPVNELIQLNEESVWAGSKINNNNKKSAEYLPIIQKAIFENRFDEAKDLANKYMVGTPPRIRSYQPLGDWRFHFPWEKESVGNYKRKLTLADAVHRTQYTVGENQITQQIYVSANHEVMMVEIESTAPISFETHISRERDVRVYEKANDYVYYTGQIHDKEDESQGPGGDHMSFATLLKVVFCDGSYETYAQDSLAGIRVKQSKKVVFALAGTTNYVQYLLDYNPDIFPLNTCKTIMERLDDHSSATIKKNHIAEHGQKFNRLEFSLGADAKAHIPTDERLKAFGNGSEDLSLPVLFYQYGRYLLMSSSRSPGVLPANLQGIWNKDYEAPWNADFHTNINLQMNYWPAESANLSETSLVLMLFFDRLSKEATKTAKEMYNANGWTLHHLTDPFGRTGVADGVWGLSPMNGPWMANSMYEYYAYNENVQVLEHVLYPILKGSVEWLLDFLVASPEGYLVTNPSHSPENTFKTIVNGKQVQSQLSYASTIDIQIILELFRNFEESARVLNKDQDLLNRVKEVSTKLPPIQVGKNGTIQEWIHDYEEVEPGHRHMSHLLGLYPGRSITPNEPVLFEAAKKTIETRLSAGGGHTGWSKAWIVNFYARLLDGEQAYQHLLGLIGKTCLPNLFSTHPPFQIDGNFGGTAGIAEMLLQSHLQEIHILPAIPKAWGSGKVKGIRARGDLTVNMIWQNHEIQELQIHSNKAKESSIHFKGQVHRVSLKKGWNTISKLFQKI